jgi:hypothetical protein
MAAVKTVVEGGLDKETVSDLAKLAASTERAEELRDGAIAEAKGIASEVLGADGMAAVKTVVEGGLDKETVSDLAKLAASTEQAVELRDGAIAKAKGIASEVLGVDGMAAVKTVFEGGLDKETVSDLAKLAASTEQAEELRDGAIAKAKGIAFDVLGADGMAVLESALDGDLTEEEIIDLAKGKALERIIEARAEALSKASDVIGANGVDAIRDIAKKGINEKTASDLANTDLAKSAAKAVEGKLGDVIGEENAADLREAASGIHLSSVKDDPRGAAADFGGALLRGGAEEEKDDYDSGVAEPEPSRVGYCARCLFSMLPGFKVAAELVPNKQASSILSKGVKLAQKADAQFFFHDMRREILHALSYLHVADAHIKDNDMEITNVIPNIVDAIVLHNGREEADRRALNKYVQFKVLPKAKLHIEVWATQDKTAEGWAPVAAQAILDLKRVADALLKLEKSDAIGWGMLFCCRGK